MDEYAQKHKGHQGKAVLLSLGQHLKNKQMEVVNKHELSGGMWFRLAPGQADRQ